MKAVTFEILNNLQLMLYELHFEIRYRGIPFTGYTGQAASFTVFTNTNPLYCIVLYYKHIYYIVFLLMMVMTFI